MPPCTRDQDALPETHRPAPDATSSARPSSRRRGASASRRSSPRSASTRTRPWPMLAAAAGIDIASQPGDGPRGPRAPAGPARPRFPDHPDPVRRGAGAERGRARSRRPRRRSTSPRRGSPTRRWPTGCGPSPRGRSSGTSPSRSGCTSSSSRTSASARAPSRTATRATSPPRPSATRRPRSTRTPPSSASSPTSSPRPSTTRRPTSTSSPRRASCASATGWTASSSPCSVPENLLRFQDAIISRVKIMARLNISERRLPQDGRINFKAGGHDARHPRLDHPDDLRRVDLAAPPQQEEGGLHDGQARDERGGAGPDQAGPRLPARHHPRHRPDRLRQEHLAQRLPAPDQLHGSADHHDRGPDRVRGPGRQPDAGPRRDRAHLRERAPPRPAPGPRRHHGGRDPRPRDGRHRHPRVADRPPGFFDPAHERRPGRHHPPGRHGDRALPRRLRDRARHRPAPRPPPLPRVQPRGAREQGEAPRVARHPRLRRLGGRAR